MKYIITEDQYRLINEKINPRTIKIAMDKLYDDIKDAEVIPYSGDMWIINRKENYWYFDLDKDGTLWWREDFFNNFFKFFSIEKDEFVPLLINMVQDILNRKADSSLGSPVSFAGVMGDIIANKAKRKKGDHNYLDGRVGDILKNRREETKISPLKEDLSKLIGMVINEEINPRTIKIAMDKFYDDIKDAEVISYDGSIWVIDRKNKYWYFQYDNNGILWWRWDFIHNFFNLFSIKRDEYEPLLVTMMEEILNHKIKATSDANFNFNSAVNDILNHKIKTIGGPADGKNSRVKDILNNTEEKTKISSLKEDLAVWFGTKKKPKGSKQPAGPWVNICRKDKDGKHPPCGRPEASDKGYPKCRAVGVAGKMSDSEKKSACQQKRKAEKSHSKSGTGNKPKMTHYEPKNEQLHPIIRRSIRESL